MSPIAMLAIGAGAVAAVAVATSGPAVAPADLLKRGVRTKAFAGGKSSEGDESFETDDRFVCEDGDSLAEQVPDPTTVVPAPVVAMGGPVALAVVGALKAVRLALSAIKDRVCSVVGGSWRLLDVQQGARVLDVEVIVDVWYRDVEPNQGGLGVGVAPVRRWVLGGAGLTQSTKLPLRSAVNGPGPYVGKNAPYLRTGQAASDLPAKWIAPVSAEFLRPQAEVARTGQQWTLSVWLPPRGGAVAWRVQWGLVTQ